MDASSELPATPSSALLIVLQEVELRWALGEALRREGFEVVLASSTAEALAFLRSTPGLPSAVLYDLAPPQGQELRSALDAAQRWASIPQLAFATATEHGPRRAMVEPPISFTSLVLQLRRITGTLQ